MLFGRSCKLISSTSRKVALRLTKALRCHVSNWDRTWHKHPAFRRKSTWTILRRMVSCSIILVPSQLGMRLKLLQLLSSLAIASVPLSASEVSTTVWSMLKLNHSKVSNLFWDSWANQVNLKKACLPLD
jgi:hypothetical protein